MKNKSVYLLYGLACLLVILLAYNRYENNKIIIVHKNIKTLNTDIIKMYQEQFDINKSLGYLWGIKDKNKKNDSNTTKNKKNKNNTQLVVIKSKNKICIDKNCYTLLGFYYKKGVAYISFYSKTFKKGLQDFKIYQPLYKTIYIKKIKQNKLILADKNSTRRWQFQLFDVNATKYKPKDNNETNI